MHVLHAVQLYHPVPSGAARYFAELSTRLVREGHRVTTITTDAFDLEHLWRPGCRHLEELRDEHAGGTIIRLPVARFSRSPLVYPLLRRLMVELARLPIPKRISLLYRLALLTPKVPDLLPLLESPEFSDVALVHTTNITLDFFIIPVVGWARRRAIPCLCTPFVHLGEPNDRSIVRYYTMPHQLHLLQQCSAVITQTERETHFLHTAGIPASLLHTVGVGVNPEELQGGDGQRFRRNHHIDGPMVLTIGVAAYDKGTIHVVEALRQLWATMRAEPSDHHREVRQGSLVQTVNHALPPTWVHIGPQMEHFRAFCRRLPPHDLVHMRLLGFVDEQTKRDALAAADLFVLPSRTDSFGIVYLEAWCYQLPVIGAQAGGVPEVIQHGMNGLLVRFGAVDELAHAIAFLLRDRQLARTLGEHGYRTVQKQWTWERTYAQLRAIYAAHGPPRC